MQRQNTISEEAPAQGYCTEAVFRTKDFVKITYDKKIIGLLIRNSMPCKNDDHEHCVYAWCLCACHIKDGTSRLLGVNV